MSEQRRWIVRACGECGTTKSAGIVRRCLQCGFSAPWREVEVVPASDLEAAERRVEDMLDLLQWVYSETTDRNIRDRLRSALSTTEEPAR